MTAIGIADKATLDLVKSDTADLLTNDQFIFLALELLYYRQNWINCIRFGDGSLGDVVISANTELNGGGQIYQYNNLTINSGITLTANQSIIVVKDTLTINGLITASGMGGPGGGERPGNTSGPYAGNAGRDKTGYGGAGGSGQGREGYSGGKGGSTAHRRGGYNSSTTYPYMNPGEGYISGYSASLMNLALLLESGGGGGGSGYAGNDTNEDGVAGGNGGGCILIQANNIVINSGGAIRADGLNGSARLRVGCGGSGGGGGGFILLQGSITNNGTISVAGGLGNGDSAGNKGGDGIIILLEVA